MSSEGESVDSEGRTLTHLVAGATAAAVSKTVTAPADRVSKLQQVDTRKFVTCRQVCHGIAREGSLKAYFRGNCINVMKSAPEMAVKLALNAHLKQLFAENPASLQPHERVVCGGVSGMVSQAVTYPLEVIRTRLALAKHGTYKGMFDMIVKEKKQEGFRSLFRGLGCATIGIFPYAGVDIAAFESLKACILSTYDGRAPTLAIFGAGIISSTVAQLSCYPLALVLTRLQAQGMNGRTVRYKGLVDALKKTVRREGWAALYKGCLPNTFRTAPAAGISWAVYEEVKQLMGMNVYH
mmetsp:Transcript_33294/g.59607  ORF Transcript_33294/g.59607 Transcript_33294/m.59607 type:complete len:295 (-) Transcript_33294:208-1092(-)